MVNSVGTLGGFAGPDIIGWAKETTGAVAPGLMITSLGGMAAAILVGVLALQGRGGAER